MWKWNFLPWPGGLLDQDSEVLDTFEYIEAERAKAEEEERKKESAKAKNGRGK